MLQEFNALGLNNTQEVIYNPSYDDLYQYETDAANHGLEQVTMTEFGAVAVDTGQFTGRSPKDKYIVSHSDTDGYIWRDEGSDNKPLSQEAWSYLKDVAVRQLNGKRIFVMDGFCGANENTRMCVRLVTEVAWMAHFFKNMFIRPKESELDQFKPDWTILNACKTTAKRFQDYDLHDEVFIAFNIQERITCIGGTWYGGEIKKGIFTMMHYFLPLKDIAALHCSANEGEDGDTALFFGLSGTGKTTLSTDPKRQLIGDDEHGWDDDGIFNLEGGCYAKCVGLSEEKEPDIYRAIKRDALLENVAVDEKGRVDFDNISKTQNTRVSYPLYHIDNIKKPVSKGGHPKNVIFLTCDAFGVLPPISKLTKEQAMYHFLSGYTAKVAGTECGVKEPQAVFSACFGQPFLVMHPTVYADLLAKKIEQYGSHVWLINTGWYQGQYGEGSRLPLDVNRASIDQIVNGTLAKVPYEKFPIFGFEIPKMMEGVDASILNPRNTWNDKDAYDAMLKYLAQMFVRNFVKFTGNEQGDALVAAGPQ